MSAYKFPITFHISPLTFSPPTAFHRSHSILMARTTGNSHLWKQTPSTNLTKAQLLELANAKDARVLYLGRKNSKCRIHTTNPSFNRLSICFNDLIEERKAKLREVQAALAVAQETQGVAQPAATALIPKPRGTSGRGDFNLAKAMKVDKKVCHEIQVCPPFHRFTLYPFAHHVRRLSSVRS